MPSSNDRYQEGVLWILEARSHLQRGIVQTQGGMILHGICGHRTKSILQMRSRPIVGSIFNVKD